MANLYELSAAWQEVESMLDDEDIPENAIADTIESIKGEITDEAVSIGKILCNIESDTQKLKDEIARLTAKKKVLENRGAFLKNTLQTCMESVGMPKIKTPLFNFNIQKNPPSLIIDDEGLIPSKYFIPQPDKVNTTQLKNDIKAGVYTGECAHLEQSKSLRIK